MSIPPPVPDKRSLVSELPPELVREIALRGLDLENGHGALSGINVLMGGVCRLWRATIYEDSSLWTQIGISPRPETKRPYDPRNIRQSLKLYFDLSKGRPLDVRIFYEEHNNEVYSTIPELQGQFDRLRSLHVARYKNPRSQSWPVPSARIKSMNFNVRSLHFKTFDHLFPYSGIGPSHVFEMVFSWDRGKASVNLDLRFATKEEASSKSITAIILTEFDFEIRKSFLGLSYLDKIAQDPPLYDEVLQILEGIDVDKGALKSNNIYHDLQHVLALPELPVDEPYEFRKRAYRICLKWEPLID